MTDFAIPAPRHALRDTLANRQRQTYSFGDLVHIRWDHKKHADDERARKRHEDVRAQFEAEHGKIVDDYWSEGQAAGVALCCKRRSFGRREWSLHRAMGDLATGRPGYSQLLLRSARQSVGAASLLRGMAQRMATAHLFALSRDIMASLEAKGDDPEALVAYERDLHYIADYADEAGRRAARVVYLTGLGYGVLALAVLAPALAVLFSSVSVPDVDSTLFVGCLVAGSIGAAMSVLIRLSGNDLEVDHKFGRDYLVSLAGVRPLIGAVFALLLYFAFKGALLKQVNVPDHGAGEFAFFVTSAFLIGFSERFAKQIVRTAELTAGGGAPPTTPPAAPAGAAAPAPG